MSIFNLSYPEVSIRNTEESFPVHRIYCVGQNYADHAIEMGSDPDREQPFFFSKPADAITESDQLPWPSRTSNLHHEVELVVALSAGGSNLSLGEAKQCVFGYAVGVDLTKRDLQSEAKQKGRPWDVAKGFDLSAPISEIVPIKDWLFEGKKSIVLSVNDIERQSAVLGKLIWDIPELISELSTLYTLSKGDLIFTGTPAGVSMLNVGDVVSATVEGLTTLKFKIG